MATRAQLRTRLRTDLRDTDGTAYRWTDADLDRHLDQANKEYSLAAPLENTFIWTSTGLRSYVPTTEIIELLAVEYPINLFPASFIPFQFFGQTVTFLTTSPPQSGEQVRFYHTWTYNLDAVPATFPTQHEDILLTGAAGYAAQAWAAYAANRPTTSQQAVAEFKALAQDYLTRFRADINRLRRRLKVRQFYTPAAPLPSQTTDPGP